MQRGYQTPRMIIGPMFGTTLFWSSSAMVTFARISSCSRFSGMSKPWALRSRIASSGDHAVTPKPSGPQRFPVVIQKQVSHDPRIVPPSHPGLSTRFELPCQITRVPWLGRFGLTMPARRETQTRRGLQGVHGAAKTANPQGPGWRWRSWPGWAWLR